ncbi:SRPBCC family protein [Pseudoroseicyclus sp. H15]
MTAETRARADFEIDRAAHTIRFTRHFSAPPERVYAAWTEPEQLSQWWDPTGKPLAACEMDLREGGTFRFVNVDHAAHPFEGTYTRVDPPRGFGMAAMGATSEVTFEPEGEGTRMVMEMRCSSAEQLEMFLQRGIADGTAVTLRNLEGWLEG